MPYAAEIAVQVMEGVAELVAVPMTVRGARLSVRTSIGIVDGSVHADPEQLMDLADQAVYRSKRTRRPMVWQAPVYELEARPAVTDSRRFLADLACSAMVAGGAAA